MIKHPTSNRVSRANHHTNHYAIPPQHYHNQNPPINQPHHAYQNNHHPQAPHINHPHPVYQNHQQQNHPPLMPLMYQMLQQQPMFNTYKFLLALNNNIKYETIESQLSKRSILDECQKSLEMFYNSIFRAIYLRF